MAKVAKRRTKKTEETAAKTEDAKTTAPADLPATDLPATAEMSKDNSEMSKDNSEPEIIDQQLPDDLSTEAEFRNKSTEVDLPVARIFNGVAKLELPIAVTGDYVRRKPRIDIKDMTRKQRRGLSLLMEGMKCEGSRLDNGHVVNNHLNALRKLLELIADAGPE